MSYGKISDTKAAVFLSGTDRLTSPPPTVTVHQGEFNHEVLEFEYRPTTMVNKSFVSGSLISVVYGLNGPGLSRLFVGYVNHTEPLYIDGEKGQHRIRVMCIGPTFQMKGSNQGVYTNQPLDVIIKKIANTYRLNTSVTPTSYSWASTAQQGQSDWLFLCKLARQAGYNLIPNGTTIKANPRNLSALRSRIGNNFSVLTLADIGDGSLMEFYPLVGSESPGGGTRATRQAAGVDARTGQPIYSMKTPPTAGLALTAPPPLFVSNTVDTPVRNLSEANAALVGQDGDNKMYQEAKLRGWGDVNFRPGGLVYINGTSTNTNGFWYIKDVRHEVTTGTHPLYTVYATICRDSVGKSPSVPLPQIRPTTTPSGYDLTPPSTIVGGAWVSAYAA